MNMTLTTLNSHVKVTLKKHNTITWNMLLWDSMFVFQADLTNTLFIPWELGFLKLGLQSLQLSLTIYCDKKQEAPASL